MLQPLLQPLLQPVQRGRLTLQLAPQATFARGNGRLVVISHGSGGAPWAHADLARQWVAAGFVVALPQHQGDNDRDPGRPGPDSWALRPAEVPRAIDAVAQHPRLAPLPALDKGASTACRPVATAPCCHPCRRA